jgi:hypothetical protein
METVLRRIAVCVLALLLACDAVLPAGAQSSEDTGVIRIAVTGTSDGAALANARVFLLGPNVASALTNKSGIVKYTDVQSGLYRVRVSRPRYRTTTSAQFELLGEKEVDVAVILGPSTDTAGTAAASASTTDREHARRR